MISKFGLCHLDYYIIFGLTSQKPVHMLRKCEDIRNEGIEGVLPTTGSTPSTTAKWGLATNTDVARSVGFGSK